MPFSGLSAAQSQPSFRTPVFEDIENLRRACFDPKQTFDKYGNTDHQEHFRRYWEELRFLAQMGILRGNILYPAMGHDIFPGYFGSVVGLNTNSNAVQTKYNEDGSRKPYEGYKYNFLMDKIFREYLNWPVSDQEPDVHFWS